MKMRRKSIQGKQSTNTVLSCLSMTSEEISINCLEQQVVRETVRSAERRASCVRPAAPAHWVSSASPAPRRGSFLAENEYGWPECGGDPVWIARFDAPLREWCAPLHRPPVSGGQAGASAMPDSTAA
jgi:hypothetical protein